MRMVHIYIAYTSVIPNQTDFEAIVACWFIGRHKEVDPIRMLPITVCATTSY